MPYKCVRGSPEVRLCTWLARMLPAGGDLLHVDNTGQWPPKLTDTNKTCHAHRVSGKSPRSLGTAGASFSCFR